jgi:hypothetical protein
MALLAVLKIRIGYLSYEISRHHHPTFLLFPSDILSFFIRHRFNNQRCHIAAHPLAFRVIYTHKRNRFTHTTATYTRKRNRPTHTTAAYTRKRNWFTHKNTSKWLICEPKVPHFTSSRIKSLYIITQRVALSEIFVAWNGQGMHRFLRKIASEYFLNYFV